MCLSLRVGDGLTLSCSSQTPSQYSYVPDGCPFLDPFYNFRDTWCCTQWGSNAPYLGLFLIRFQEYSRPESVQETDQAIYCPHTPTVQLYTPTRDT
jgi:hypothetical protein